LYDAGTTGAQLTQNPRLTVDSPGWVVVRATIVNGTAQGTNFTQNFQIEAVRNNEIPQTGYRYNLPLRIAIIILSFASATVGTYAFLSWKKRYIHD
jgi:hypothetical protein